MLKSLYSSLHPSHRAHKQRCFPVAAADAQESAPVQGQAGRPGKTALTYESYPHNSTDFAPSTRGVRDLFRNPIWKLFRLSRISCLTGRSSVLATISQPIQRRTPDDAGQTK